MQLYGSYTSPFVRHCRVVALQTGAELELIETKSPAADNPTLRVPYLVDGDLKLTDSTVIVRHLRERAGQAFLADINAHDRFCLITTLLDTTVNCYLLAQDGITPAQSPYLTRQQQRIERVLAELQAGAPAYWNLEEDADLRLACYLEWAVYRDLVDLTHFERLTALLKQVSDDAHLRATAPPAK